MSENNNPKRTELSSLGEFGLIDYLTKGIELKNPSSRYGVGDDAAVIDHVDFQTLVSVDLLVEGIHFDLGYTPLKHLGYKAAVVNFSDMAAMNARPTQIVVGVALSNRFSLEAIEEIYVGIRLACEKYKVDLVGGDTTSSRAGLFISVTVIGQAKASELCYRKGASENDLLCVSGDLGGAYMGLLLLEREKAVFKANPNMQPDLDGFDYVLERQLKPEARLDVVDALEKAGILPSSMIDISDGLASEIKHLCKASGLGCAIYEEKLPIDPMTASVAEDFKLVPTVVALNGGEDYELLFTVKVTDFEKVNKIPGISIIGHMTSTAGEAILLTRDNESFNIEAQGWDSLSNEEQKKN
ncbi:MAG: thiamine-phosphate kinase [Bacteroidetes bacterium]|nr:thiamine-phosphate kinase [Bacteroidota bacterium]MBU2465647.1 thiamine-phosphate kinase [Bacteroidota bacterium]MBU2557194.1 thiamine-phosphate kinase [Bacteroidota bacterium]